MWRSGYKRGLKKSRHDLSIAAAANLHCTKLESIGDAAKDHVIGEGGVPGTAEIVLPISIESHGSGHVDRDFFVTPDNAWFDRDGIAGPSAAFGITDQIVRRDTFDASAKAQSQALRRPNGILQADAGHVGIPDGVSDVVLSLGSDHVGAAGIGEGVLEEPFVSLEFDHNAPSAVAGLNGVIDIIQDRSGGPELPIGFFVFASGRFHAETESDVAVGETFRVKQPVIANQAQIAEAVCVHGMAVGAVVLVKRRPAGCDVGKRKAQSEPARDRVSGGKVKGVDVVDDLRALLLPMLLLF